MPDNYSLTVHNDSQLPSPDVALFAHLPSKTSFGSLDTAWLVQQVDAGNTHVFSWEITWGFAWASQGTAADVQWTASGHAPADPQSAEQCAVLLDYDGDFQLKPTTGKPDGATLVVNDTSDVPDPAKTPSSVAVTLGGQPVSVLTAGPNMSQTFTLHPTYYIDAGSYVAGQMVDGASVTQCPAVTFEGGVTALTATLAQDNTWSVVPS